MKGLLCCLSLVSLTLPAAADVQTADLRDRSARGLGLPAMSPGSESRAAGRRCTRDDEGTPSLDLSRIDRAVTDEFAVAWRRAGIGHSTEEALVLLLASRNGSYLAVQQPRTGERSQFTFARACDVIAIVHTHPNSRPAEPSPVDKRVAQELGVMVATITSSGMFVYDPVEKRTTRVLDRLDWLQAETFRQRSSIRGPGECEPEADPRTPLSRQLAVEPRSCLQPLPLDGDRRNSQDLGGLFHAHAAEVPHLDDLALAGIDRGQPAERSVQRQHVDPFSWRHERRVVERDLAVATTVPGCPARARAVDEVVSA
jgi:hypothetical protein